MSIREVVVHSLGDLIAQTTPSEPDPTTGRRRSSGVYRGAADAGWPLLTSLDQLEEFRHRSAGSPNEASNWMRAFSEILLAPPAVEILRVEKPRSA